MSRRANPPADRATQNQQTIKNLLKLDCNKTCADCKRSKHPRWASWNLGVFVCIRCSGIHRGMGTHISRVKSVDLDAWTDEQMQSILKWGNARANKYWESKLAPGHVPSDAKMENFIRTKYEAKRWVMDGPIPDPATLGGDGDDDVPLAVVQEKAKAERSSPQRTNSAVTQPPQRPQQQQQQAINLFDDDPPAPPERPKTTDVSGSRAQAASGEPGNAAAPKQAKAGDSLLGLDFFGSTETAPTNRPSSTASNTTSTGPSRPDLKQSILSLYSSAPKPQPPPQHERNTSFGSLTSMQSPQAQPSQQNDSTGGLTDAFRGLSFPSTTSTTAARKQSNVSAFDSLTSPKSPPSMPKVTSPPQATGGGGFFDSASSKPAPKPQQSRTQSVSSGNNFDLIGATMGSTKSPAAPPSTATDTFDLFSSPAVSPPAPAPQQQQQQQQRQNTDSVFNLSSPPPQPEKQSSPPVSAPAPDITSMLSANAMDPWGGNAWDAPPEPATQTKQPSSMMQVPDKLTADDLGAGWGSSTTTTKPAPTVSGDEDFGGWTTSAPLPPQNNNNNQATNMPKPPGGFGAADDLFSNVWE